MTTSSSIGFIAALLQLGVAFYAFYLARQFKVRSIGWILFAAFGLMFSLRLSLAFPDGGSSEGGPFGSVTQETLALVTSILLAMAVVFINRLVRNQQKVEAVLQASEQRFTSFADNNPAVAWMKDDAGRYVYVNQPFERCFCVSRAHLLNRTDFDLWKREVAEPLRESDHRVLSSGEALQTYETVPNPEGQEREWFVVKFPFLDPEGRRFVGGMAFDITEQRRAENALRDSERRLRSIWENSADGMRLTNEEGVIVAVNPAFCRLVSMDEGQLVGQPLSSVYPPENRDKLLQQYRSGFQRRSIEKQFERRVIFNSGSVLDLEISNSFVELEHQPALLLSMFRDITERRQAESQRLTLERKLLDGQKLESLGILAGGIAHDFNNLLTAVMGNASLALMDLPESSPVRRYLLNIEKSSVQAAELCRQLLAYSGRGQFIVQELSLNSVTEEMRHLLNISVSKKIVLRLDLAQALPSVEADAAQIRQVIMNLAINASEAIGDRSGVISITTGTMRADRAYLTEAYLPPTLAEGNYVYLEVSDTGTGMTPEVKARIFDPFFTTKFTGRGLGLAAVLGIVRGHKGALKVYSEPGRGSSFKLLLPCKSAPADLGGTADSQGPTWSGHGTVLVVDDEDTVRTVAQRMLERFGYTVLTAADGQEGVDVFRAHADEIVAVVLDMTMPRLAGDEAFREIRRIRADARVILMSGYNEQDATHRFAGKGLSGFLQKPFNSTELQQKLRALEEQAVPTG